MGVDNGYGSGASRTAANSAARRRAAGAAVRNKAAAKFAKANALSVAKQTPLSKQTRDQWNLLINASRKSPLAREQRRLSTGILRNTTGFNKKDGVDAGDLAGLATTLPLGLERVVGGTVARLASRAIPKGMRIAAAASRVSRGSRSTIRRAAGAIADAEYTGSLGRQYVNAAEADSRKLLSGFSNEYTHRGYGAFDENLGTELTRTNEYGGGIRSGEEMVRRGLAKRVETPSGAAYYSTALEETGKIGSSMVDKASKLRSAASSKIAIAEQRATTKAASAEIRRRLAALRKAKEAEKKAPKQNNPKKPLDWGAL